MCKQARGVKSDLLSAVVSTLPVITSSQTGINSWAGQHGQSQSQTGMQIPQDQSSVLHVPVSQSDTVQMQSQVSLPYTGAVSSINTMSMSSFDSLHNVANFLNPIPSVTSPVPNPYQRPTPYPLPDRDSSVIFGSGNGGFVNSMNYASSGYPMWPTVPWMMPPQPRFTLPAGSASHTSADGSHRTGVSTVAPVFTSLGSRCSTSSSIAPASIGSSVTPVSYTHLTLPTKA